MLAFAQPKVDADFRAVWIASVKNIDWPSHPELSVAKQQEEYIQMMKYFSDLNFNAVFVQIRTACDAFYPSELVPWSRFLTGQEGRAPSPMYDPLDFMIDQAHQHGLEFHAWFNPYRATTDLDTSILAPTHDFYQKRDWIIRYGSKYYLDPGRPEVQQHITNIIEEVVRRYPIDGVHFDDYFYPYKIKDTPFNDEKSYRRFGALNFANIDDWRRANVDSLIRAVHQRINAIRPSIAFGISPFGVWRNKSVDPKGSATRAGQTNYDDLYADPLHWMEQGWVDYMVPQLYWSMDYEPAAYRVLANWWDKEGQRTKVPIYLGMGAYKVENNHDSAWYEADQIPRQLALNQSLSNIQGQVFFSAKSLINKAALSERLQKDHFNNRVLTGNNPATLSDRPTINKAYAFQDTLYVEVKMEANVPIRSVLLLKPKKRSADLVQQVYARPSILLEQPLKGKKATYCLAYYSEDQRISEKTKRIKVKRKRKGWKTKVR